MHIIVSYCHQALLWQANVLTWQSNYAMVGLYTAQLQSLVHSLSQIIKLFNANLVFITQFSIVSNYAYSIEH